MNRDVTNMRQDYNLSSLHEHEVASDPITQFQSWFEEAITSNLPEPNAMTLATVSNGRPSARIVLLKGYDQRGFVFYTNYESRKGRELIANPLAALTFFWPELERQIRIEGKAEKISPEESDQYFESRPRGSRLGAWASPQSQVISSREVLEDRLQNLQSTYAEHASIPRPEYWGGFRIIPEYIEFWQGRKSRLHDRLSYSLESKDWIIRRLAP